jgi:hypothetical protein
MARAYRHIMVDRQGDISIVRLHRQRVEEKDIEELAAELLSLVDEDGCRKMVLRLGPEPPQCLYSVFLAKLIALRRHLAEHDGALKISDAAPVVIEVFEACQLADYFDFYPDCAAAVAAFGT